MKRNIHDLVKRTLIASAALLITSTATAETFPARTLTIVVPFSAGSASDGYARQIAPKLSAQIGQSVVIENKEGAGGLIGAQSVLRAKPDGYTLLLAASPWSYTPYFYKTAPYVPLKAFQPIAKIGAAPSVLITGMSSPFTTTQELIAYAKKNPNKVTYASAGMGTFSNMSGEYFKKIAQVDILHVPYKATSQAMTDVIGHQIGLNYASLSAALPHIKGQKVRALGVTSPTRSPSAPDIPTLAEGGAPGLDVMQWFGFVAPAGMPADAVQYLNQKINVVLKDPEIVARFRDQGIEVTPKSVAEFTSDISKDIDKMVTLGKEMGINYD